MPNCYVCKKSMDKWLEADNGRKFCSESCFSQTFPTCDCCGKKMKQWTAYENGKKYCSEQCAKQSWHKCSICSTPMNQWITDDRGRKFCSERCHSQTFPVCDCCGTRMKEWRETENGHKYCSERCLSTTLPKCDVCSKPMNQWTTDERGKKFCSESCFSQILPVCNCCGKRMKQWLSFNDGRKYCSESCSKQSWPQCSVCSTRMNEWHETKEGKKFCSEKCLKQNLYIGAHLVSPRTGYTHHGIYCGDNKVIHYSGFNELFSNDDDVVEIITLKNFDNGNGYTIREYYDRIYFGDECVRRAKSRLGEKKYGLLTNNCEHFACWCITGKEKSEQVNEVVAKAGATIAGIASNAAIGTTAANVMGYGIAAAEFTGLTVTRNIAMMYVGGAAAPFVVAGYAAYKVIKWAKN